MLPDRKDLFSHHVALSFSRQKMNPGENHILAIVVTYYPDKQLLGDNIAAFIDHVDKVLVWENTPDLDKEAFRIPAGGKIEYCGDGNNSISRTLNYGWR